MKREESHPAVINKKKCSTIIKMKFIKTPPSKSLSHNMKFLEYLKLSLILESKLYLKLF